MSQPSRTRNTSARSSRETVTRRKWLLSSVIPRSLLTPVRTVSFWVAVTIPFLHLSLLFTGTGIETTSETLAFLALLALNVVALVVGHPHRN